MEGAKEEREKEEEEEGPTRPSETRATLAWHPS